MLTSTQEAKKNLTSARKTIDPLSDGISSIELVRISGSDLDVVNAARVSFGKTLSHVSERDEKLIKYLIKHNHTSPFEHNQLSFRIKAPIFVARQWMRHRMNSYNEISYRYVEINNEYYTPIHWRFQDKNNRQASCGSFKNDELTELYTKSIEESYGTYKRLLEAGVAREIARSLLPLCTYTEFIFTCNLHSLMHFMRLRLESGAQYEIQCYAKGLLNLSLGYFPVSLGAWREKYNVEISDQIE